MERLTLACLQHLPTAVLFVADLTGECGTTVANQWLIRWAGGRLRPAGALGWLAWGQASGIVHCMLLCPARSLLSISRMPVRCAQAALAGPAGPAGPAGNTAHIASSAACWKHAALVDWMLGAGRS